MSIDETAETKLPEQQNLFPPPDVPGELEQEVERYKPGWLDGMKLGAAYFVDPLGRMLENWENIAVNGKGIRENYSETLFEKLSEPAHKGNSFAKYAGGAIGIGAAAAAVSVLSIPYGTMAVGTFAYDAYKTFGKRERPEPIDAQYFPTLGEGFKGGLGIGIDPFGFFLENIERNVVNGKGIDDNRMKTVTSAATYDARQGNSVEKYVGGALGWCVGAGISLVTFGLVPFATGVYDVFASIGNKKKS